LGISKKCGTYTVETVSRTHSSAGRSSHTRSYADRDLIMPQEVMQEMRADDQIVFVRGQRPIRRWRAIFFCRKDMKALVGVSRFQT
jgi:type IV secretion system protein VirD4